MSSVPPVISFDWLKGHLDDPSVKVIDSRRLGEYSEGHIPGALSIPLSSLFSDERPEHVSTLLGRAGVDNNSTLVVYDDYGGTHAARLAWAATHVGQLNVGLLNGGFNDWIDLGFEVSRKEENVEPTTHLSKLRREIVADANYILGQIDRSDFMIFGARERLNFLEGHIPQATSLPWRALVERGRTLYGSEKLAKMFREYGVQPDGEVVIYCGSHGTLSALAYFALLHAGHQRVRLYAGSFQEWKSLGLPVERVTEARYEDLTA